MSESNNLVNICYEGASGSSDIRTCYIEGILHFSLKDILIVLNKENRELGDNNPTRHIPTLIKSLIVDLDSDEYTPMPADKAAFDEDRELFVTQPGLNRIMGNDKSKAGRKFQRWLYHEVVPSLTKYGFYPPPQVPRGSALSQTAELMAQNARVLADTIRRQDELEQVVSGVKIEIKDVVTRVQKLEGESDSEFISTVRQWFEKNNLELSNENELAIVTWCEKLSIQDAKPQQSCPSGERIRTKFYHVVIEEAKAILEGMRT
ncbi:BRO-like protein [Serratia marcescens]|uniref:BRO-like protein n=1 Tax=Serratia marcescens TaxID=615 RepID=UPI000C12F22A|nr:BRO-like protein [Serratia marcescens]PHY71097.1 BRO-like protein [Serratia marcescens]PIC06737.1 BRO-like protein [Serratia marcescens]CAI2080654.1 Uncharacterised protein [Serratia marcescens]HAT2876977.1 BRO-like protein [Serratia marcescens]HAT2887423.1 BRO-like protein [Serratia marcescens]